MTLVVGERPDIAWRVSLQVMRGKNGGLHNLNSYVWPDMSQISSSCKSYIHTFLSLPSLYMRPFSPFVCGSHLLSTPCPPTPSPPTPSPPTPSPPTLSPPTPSPPTPSPPTPSPPTPAPPTPTLLAALDLQVLRARQHNHLVDMFASESRAPTFMERLGLVFN